MTIRIARISLAAFAAGALALLALALATETRSTVSAQGAEYTVELLDSGPNPPICAVSFGAQDSRVFFLNKSSKARHIYFGNPQIPSEIGLLQPGEKSVGPIGITSAANVTYWDALEEGYQGLIFARHNIPPACSPLAPTPTPSPTPIPTASPSPTPPPTATVRHPKCTGLMPGPRAPIQGCGIVTVLATDGPGAD